MNMPTLDAACAAHLQHGAMAGGDPLTDELFAQMQAAAVEGAQPAIPYSASQPTPAQQAADRRWWLLGTTLLAALAGAALGF